MKKHFVQPCFDRVLIRRLEAKKEVNGILVPDQSQERPNEGIIVALGPEVNTPERQMLEQQAYGSERRSHKLNLSADEREARIRLETEFEQTFNLGDHVLFGAYSGVKVKVDEGGEEFALLKQDEIQGVVREVEVPDADAQNVLDADGGCSK